MRVIVREIVGGANHGNVKTVNADSLSNSRIHDWVFRFGVCADHNEKISLINALYLRVKQVLTAEINSKLSLIRTHINIVAIESVEQIFEGDD